MVLRLQKEIWPKCLINILVPQRKVFVTAISSNLYRWQQAIDSSKNMEGKYAWLACLLKNIKMAKDLDL